jgi:hypothetical protein
MSILKKIFQSKTVKTLFWTILWGGNLLTIAIMAFFWVMAYFYPIGHMPGQVPPAPAPRFLEELGGGGFIFLGVFNLPILIINIFFFLYLVFFKKRNEKMPYKLTAIILSIIVTSFSLFAGGHMHISRFIFLIQNSLH